MPTGEQKKGDDNYAGRPEREKKKGIGAKSEKNNIKKQKRKRDRVLETLKNLPLGGKRLRRSEACLERYMSHKAPWLGV